MKYAQSTTSRRIVGHFEHGDLLPDAIVDLCQSADVRAGEVRAQGILSRVDLGIYSHENRSWDTAFRAEDTIEMLSLVGNISMMGEARVINAKALVAYSSHGRTHTVGGQLRSATVQNVEFVIDAFDDLELSRGLDAETQLPLWKIIDSRVVPIDLSEDERAAPEATPAAPEPTATAAPTPAPAETKADVAPKAEPIPRGPVASESEWRAAARRSRSLLDDDDGVDDAFDDDADLEEVELQTGDTLLHPRLGECTVVRVDDDVAAYIRIHKSQRISKLALTVVRLEPVEDHPGERVFKVLAKNT